MKKEPHHEHRHVVRSSHNVGFNKKYTTIALYALITLFIAAVFIFFLMNGDKYTRVFEFFVGILSPIFIGMLIAYLLNPCMSFFENVVFISRPRRALRKARKKLFQAKLKFDSVRTNEGTTEAGRDAAAQALAEARTELATAKEAVCTEVAARDAKYAKKAAKKRRPSFHPDPPKDRSHPMRGVSILCTYLIFLTVITLILWIVIPQCIDSLLSLLNNLESYIRGLPAQLQDLVNRNETVRDLYDLVNARIDLKAWISGFVEDASGLLSDLLTSLPNFAVSVISSIASGITNLILSVFLSIYFLASKEKLSSQLQRLCRAFLPKRAFHHLRHAVVEVDHKFGRFIAGKILDSTIIGILSLIAMMIMGIPYYQMLALIIGITNIIPFFGPFIGAFIGGFIILISEPAKLIPFVIMVLILQQLEGNVIEPQVLGDSLGLSPVWIMIAIVIMSGLFGVFGMIFGVPIFAVIYTLLKEAVEHRLIKRKKALTATGAQADENVPEDPASDTEEDSSSAIPADPQDDESDL
ncbi:MAG: AI-2E family transporter [Clostridia bacterium]|nr:AI-2E family transporter [Clostridia bacterium]